MTVLLTILCRSTWCQLLKGLILALYNYGNKANLPQQVQLIKIILLLSINKCIAFFTLLQSAADIKASFTY